jgi:hypothetical protein
MMNSESARTQEGGTAWRVLALTGIGLLLRVVALGHKGLWQDEVFSVLFARPSNAEFWTVLRTAEANMALYYLALREWMQLFTSDAGVRTLSVIPGVLSIPATYALGARLYSRRVGLWAAGLLAINACAVVYSQEARGYSMLVLFVALSSWAFVRLLERASLWNAALYIGFTVCAFYSHFYAIFVILAQACTLGLLPTNKIPLKSVIGSWLVIAVATMPGLRVVLLSHGSNLWWLPRAGVLEIYRTLTFLAAESGKAVGAILGVLLLVPIGVALHNAWQTCHQSGKSFESFRAGFAPLGLIVPMVGTMALSVWRPMFFHRFLIVCLVPFVLLAAAGLEQMRNFRVRPALAIGIIVLSGVAVATSYTKVREDWRGAAAFTRGVGAGDPIAFFLKDAAAPFAYYRERLDQPLRAEQLIRLESQPSKEQVAQWAKQYPRIWMVRFPAGTKDTIEPQLVGTMENEYRLCQRGNFKAISVSWWSTGACPGKP